MQHAERVIAVLDDSRVRAFIGGALGMLVTIRLTVYLVSHTSLNRGVSTLLWVAIGLTALGSVAPLIVRSATRRWWPERDLARNWGELEGLRIWKPGDLVAARHNRRDPHEMGGGIDRQPVDVELFRSGRTGDLQADFSLLLGTLDTWLRETHRKRDPGLPVFWIADDSGDQRSLARLACLAQLTQRRLLVGDARHNLDVATAAARCSIHALASLRPRAIAIDLRDGAAASWESFADMLAESRSRMGTRATPREVLIVAGTPSQADVAGTVLGALAEFQVVTLKGERGAGPYSRGGTALVTDRVYNRGLPATGAELFGRTAELDWLDQAWADPAVRVVSVVAMGGIGKSALINEWLDRMRRDDYRGAERVLLWSFYSQGTREELVSADPFINDALAWLGGGQSQTLSPAVKGEELAKLILGQRMLVVLDGLEPLQQPAGRPTVSGMLTNVSVKTMLERLAESDWDGLCVITTRVQVTDLKPLEEGERSMGAVDHRKLPPLDRDAGVALLGSLIGNGPSVKEMGEAVKEYQGHALAIVLLGTYIRDVCEGNLARRALLEEIPLAQVREGAHARRVMTAYENWLTEGKRHAELAILRLIGLFDRPAEPEAMTALLAAPSMQAFSHLSKPGKGLWDDAVAALMDMGLLNRKSAGVEGSLDAHPLVREHFRYEVKRALPDLWLDGNRALYVHYNAAVRDPQPSTTHEMQLLYSAVTHGCAAREYQRVFDEVLLRRIWRDRRTTYSTRHLGLTSADIAALSNYFKRGQWSELRDVTLSTPARVLILTNAGVRLRQLGQLMDARASFGAVAREIDPEHAGTEDLEAASYGAAQYAELLVIAGRLKDGTDGKESALESATSAIAFADVGKDAYFEMHAHGTLGEAHFMLGDTDGAGACFQRAIEIEQTAEPTPRPPFLYSQGLFRYGYYLIECDRAQEILDAEADDAAWGRNGDDSSLLSQAIRLLILGAAHRALIEQHASRLASLDAGEGWLDRAVLKFREAGYTDYTVRGLLERARFHRIAASTADRARHSAAAMRDLREASYESKSDSMSLLRADVQLERAALRLDAWEQRSVSKPQDDRHEIASALQSGAELVERIGYGHRSQMLQELDARAAALL